jgi:hypothetical protein
MIGHADGPSDSVRARRQSGKAEVGDALGLAGAIQPIPSDDELRARQSAAARRYALETDSIDQSADATERLYSELVG